MKRKIVWCGKALAGLVVVLMWASLLRPGPGWAQAADEPPAAPASPVGPKFSGFGTVGVVHTSLRQADFIGTFSQEDGVGASRRWGLQPDTRLGLQADLPMGSHWSATVQGLVEYSHGGRYRPGLSMGFVKWQPSDDWSLRLGRLPWAAYTTSDYRKVGYSQPWVRPPQALYMTSFDQTDGIDASWRTQLGGTSLRLQAMAGQSKRDLGSSRWSARGLLGGNLLLENGDWTFRLSHLQYRRFTLDLPPVDAVLEQVAAFDPQGVAALRYRDRPVGYSTLGLGWDDGTWLVLSELAYGRMPHTYLADGVEAYVTLGRRFGSLTPTFTVAAMRYAGRRHSANPVLQQVIAAGESRETQSTSLGLRWDARPGLALKAQLDLMRNGVGQTGVLGNMQPGYRSGLGFRVFSLAADFVF